MLKLFIEKLNISIKYSVSVLHEKLICGEKRWKKKVEKSFIKLA
jgi:hypothetical protein